MADANSNCALISRFRFFLRYLRFSPNQSKLRLLASKALQELIEFYPLLSSIQHSLDTTNSDHDAIDSFSDFMFFYRDLIDAVNESVLFDDLVVKRFRKSNSNFREINNFLEISYKDINSSFPVFCEDLAERKIVKRASQ